MTLHISKRCAGYTGYDGCKRQLVARKSFFVKKERQKVFFC